MTARRRHRASGNNSPEQEAVASAHPVQAAFYTSTPLVSMARVQAKLNIGRADDAYEREADAVADHVTRGKQVPAISALPATSVITRMPTGREEFEEKQPASQDNRRQPVPEEEEETEQKKQEQEEPVQTKPGAGVRASLTGGLQNRIQSLKGAGQALPKSERRFFERRIGADFSNVRVHNDARAAHMAGSINARAFTQGRDVFFGSGQYAPGSRSGRKLLAHELTHVVQQGKSNDHGNPQRSQLVQRQPFAPGINIGSILRSLATPLTQQDINRIVSAEIQRMLHEFRNIVVTIDGVGVAIQTSYFMNTAARRGQRRPIQRAFNNVVQRLRQASVIHTGARPYQSGEAVQYGKATPQDIARFLNAFVNTQRGRRAIIRYAQRLRWLPRPLRRLLRRTQIFNLLGPANLQRLMQQWVRSVGIGVDCSGFVQLALIRAQEAVRTAAQFQNIMAPAFGMPLSTVPQPFGRRARSAHSFQPGRLRGRRGRQVRRPTDLRPGDAWVVNYGPRTVRVRRRRRVRIVRGNRVRIVYRNIVLRVRRNMWRHIRIVMSVAVIRNAAGNPRYVRFTAAESTSVGRVGTTSGSWRTRSAVQFGTLGQRLQYGRRFEFVRWL